MPSLHRPFHSNPLASPSDRAKASASSNGRDGAGLVSLLPSQCARPCQPLPF